MEYSEFYKDMVPRIVDVEAKNFAYGCDRCILPENYMFGDYQEHNGETTCKFCRDHEEPQFKSEEDFIRDVNLQKGEKIGVTVSGGKDSLFAWHYLVSTFGAENVVAFNHKKTGLVHPEATRNINRANEILQTELIVMEDNGMMPRFKKNLEALLNNPQPGMVRVALCTGCRYGITEALYTKGAELGIKKYVSAASYLELAPFKEELLAQKGCGDETRGLLEGLKENGAYHFDSNLSYILRDHQYKYKGNLSSDRENVNVFKDYQLIDLDKYFPNDPQKMEKFVTDNLNWVRPERSWHFDCVVEEMKDIFYYGLLGYTETDFKLSAMVRHKLISRDEAIRQIEIVRTMVRNSFPQTERFLRSIGLEYLLGKMHRFYKRSPYLATPAKKAAAMSVSR